ncbi:MAG: hypothetical protein DMD87_16915 [Candidatus Rokuibacteriota bacterium]|nr:MAG: hypothetical protein DMD87_16915 [Candidatus Rokubacteria bacterium]
MCDNEYLAHYMVRERLREAERRGVLDVMLRQPATSSQAFGRGADREGPRSTRLELWWQASAAWVAHLTLPKTWNRL